MIKTKKYTLKEKVFDYFEHFFQLKVIELESQKDLFYFMIKEKPYYIKFKGQNINVYKKESKKIKILGNNTLELTVNYSTKVFIKIGDFLKYINDEWQSEYT
jgi:hypothetical protein